jgi:outer membrane protein OmpA-like peptidoglycan-associated protein
LPRNLAKGVHSLQVAGVAKVNQVRAVTAALVIAGETRFTARFAVYFLGDSPKITAKCGDLLRAIRNILKGKKAITVTVNGWVKETKIKKNDLQLSSARAANIVYVLRTIFRVKASYKFAGNGISPENTDKSRRADIVITYTK